MLSAGRAAGPELEFLDSGGFRPTIAPLFRVHAHNAGIAQLVERSLAKVEVASSSLVSRSKSSVVNDLRGFLALSGPPLANPRATTPILV